MAMPSSAATSPTKLSSTSIRRISVLGATGSIGTSTLDVVADNPDQFEVVALTAQNNVTQLANLAKHHRAKLAVIGEEALHEDLQQALSGTGIATAAGADAIASAASEPADCVVAAIVGAAGLKPTFAAVRQGCRVALANKECLVSAGRAFMSEVGAHGTELLPVDSEHSAAFQALTAADAKSIESITLTASGGPFRGYTQEELRKVTLEQALAHPTWSMGAKISIDSATMMNKGLELIEALHLFPVDPDQLKVIVHPQSIVHCLVDFCDGSVLAQLAAPDMRIPISLALAWPERMTTQCKRLNLAEIASLTFEAPDEKNFPALGLARDVMKSGDGAATVMNAANEVAVSAFLEKRIGFQQIVETVALCCESAEKEGLNSKASSLDEILGIDAATRCLAGALIRR